jgi:hypothetical protein
MHLRRDAVVDSVSATDHAAACMRIVADEERSSVIVDLKHHVTQRKALWAVAPVTYGIMRIRLDRYWRAAARIHVIVATQPVTGRDGCGTATEPVVAWVIAATYKIAGSEGGRNVVDVGIIRGVEQLSSVGAIGVNDDAVETVLGVFWWHPCCG